MSKFRKAAVIDGTTRVAGIAQTLHTVPAGKCAVCNPLELIAPAEGATFTVTRTFSSGEVVSVSYTLEGGDHLGIKTFTLEAGDILAVSSDTAGAAVVANLAEDAAGVEP